MAQAAHLRDLRLTAAGDERGIRGKTLQRHPPQVLLESRLVEIGEDDLPAREHVKRCALTDAMHRHQSMWRQFADDDSTSSPLRSVYDVFRAHFPKHVSTSGSIVLTQEVAVLADSASIETAGPNSYPPRSPSCRK